MMITSRAAMLAAGFVVAAPILFVMTGGWSNVGDGGSSKMMSIAAPSVVKPWHTKTSDDRWWQVFADHGTIDPRQLGFACDAVYAGGDWSGTDNTAALQACIDFCKTVNAGPSSGGTVKLPPGIGFCAGGVVGTSGLRMEGHGSGMQYAGFNPYPDVGASWLVYPNNFNGTAVTFNTKSPVHLAHFGIIQYGGVGTTSYAVYIDNHVPGEPGAGPSSTTYVVNFRSSLQHVFTWGGQIAVRLTNCGLFDIGYCNFMGWIGVGLYLHNDGSGYPYPIVDSGDAHVHHSHIMTFTSTLGGATCIYIDTMGGLAFDAVKTLGGQFGVQYIANITAITPSGQFIGETGEITFSNCNIEACAVNAFRLTQVRGGARLGGFNIVDTHMNLGSDEVGAPAIQSAIAIIASVLNPTWFGRGGVDDCNIIYGGSKTSPGSAAIYVGDGNGFTVRNTKFQIPANNYSFSCSGSAVNCIFENNGPGAANVGSVTAGTKVFNNT